MKYITRNFRTSAIAALLMNVEGEGTAGGAAATEVKLTRAEKLGKQVEVLTKRIEADTAKLAEVKQEIETSTRLSSVEAGTEIVARLGRAETTREVVALVLGVKDDESGARRYKIETGAGFDKDVLIIQPSQIVSVKGEEAPAAADEAAQY